MNPMLAMVFVGVGSVIGALVSSYVHEGAFVRLRRQVRELEVQARLAKPIVDSVAPPAGVAEPAGG